MTKTLNQIIFFFLHHNQNIFFSNIGNQNIFFLEKNHNLSQCTLEGDVLLKNFDNNVAILRGCGTKINIKKITWPWFNPGIENWNLCFVLFVWWCLTLLSTRFPWRSVLLVEETGRSGENHRPVASHWQTLSHNVVSSIPRLGGIITTLVVIGTDCTGSLNPTTIW